MKTLLVCISLLAGIAAFAQNSPTAKAASVSTPEMKTYVIERDIPNVGMLTDAELKGVSQKSCTVLKEMGPKIQWMHSYVTGNKIYCVYKAENEELIREHARKGGFPANSISEVKNVISPATAE